MKPKWCLLGLVLGLGILVQPARAQEKKEVVPHGVASELLEKVLADLGIRFEKAPARTAGTEFYNFDRNGYKVRLGNHGGAMLWLAAGFPKASPQQINDWNVRAKFSRAVLSRDGGREASVIEAQLDCSAGVTPTIIRQFLTRFDGEVREFDRFLSR